MSFDFDNEVVRVGTRASRYHKFRKLMDFWDDVECSEMRMVENKFQNIIWEIRLSFVDEELQVIC